MFSVLLERQNKVGIGDTVWLLSFESCFVTTIPVLKVYCGGVGTWIVTSKCLLLQYIEDRLHFDCPSVCSQTTHTHTQTSTFLLF